MSADVGPVARLTTHVLDTAAGRPAAGVRVTVDRLEPDGARVQVASAVTDSDGRTDPPLLSGADLVAGTYELRFEVGDHFARAGHAVAEPPFLDVVPVRVGLDGRSHVHVPLLVSPWSYSTYRGS